MIDARTRLFGYAGAVLLFACTSSPVEIDPDAPPRTGGNRPDVPADPATLPGDTAPEVTEPETEPTVVPFFDVDGVHAFALTIGPDAWSSLASNGRVYVEATLSAEGVDYDVGVRLKGNTTWQDIAAKPALIIDMNHYVEGQTLTGISSFYLHNMMYDPSMMHERLAFAWMRSFGVPASRTAYARLTLNGTDIGHYVAIEKENDEYLDAWWEDGSGSLYEAGSFNWPCDVNFIPGDCFETDRVGTGDDGAASLAALTAAAHATDDTWEADIEAHVDLDAFLRTMAADVLVSHYDDYGWNINNYRIYHEPSVDRWYWTSWSTDLSFGWYPWMDGPHCGTYGQNISEYATGYVLKRCIALPSCEARWASAIEEAADAFETFDMPGQIDALYDQVKAEMQTDTRKSYSEQEFEDEVTCMRAWSRQRPAQIRAQLGG